MLKLSPIAPFTLQGVQELPISKPSPLESCSFVGIPFAQSPKSPEENRKALWMVVEKGTPPLPK